MREYELPFRRRQDVGIADQLDAAGGGKTVAEQEVAVAVQQADLQTGVAGGAQGGDDFGVIGIVDVVIADPGLEKVAEDVQLRRLPGAPGKKLEEQTSRPG